MKNEKRRLSFIDKIDKIEKRIKVGFPPCISVSDSDGNKVIPAGEDPYPFLPDNVSAVHSRLFYEIFTLDINKEGVSPTDFIKVYGDGFKEGLQFLERERIDIDQLDDENKKANLIKRLKRILHDRKDNNGRTILNYGFSAQIIWTDKSMFEAGKHNGVITAIDQFAERAGLDEKDLKNEEPQPKTEKKKENNHQSIKTLEDHFHNITDFDSFINDIEKAFQNEKGKTFVGVVKILQENDVLVIQDRKVKPFLGCLKKSTNLKIPSDSYFSRELKKHSDETFEEPIRSKLDPIIDKYKMSS